MPGQPVGPADGRRWQCLVSRCKRPPACLLQCIDLITEHSRPWRCRQRLSSLAAGSVQFRRRIGETRQWDPGPRFSRRTRRHRQRIPQLTGASISHGNEDMVLLGVNHRGRSPKGSRYGSELCQRFGSMRLTPFDTRPSCPQKASLRTVLPSENK